MLAPFPLDFDHFPTNGSACSKEGSGLAPRFTISDSRDIKQAEEILQEAQEEGLTILLRSKGLT